VGTTLIGVSYGGDIAIGTDYDPEKADSDEVGIVLNCSGILVGFTGHSDCSVLTDLFIDKAGECPDLHKAAEKLAIAWVENEKLSGKKATIALLDRENAFIVSPGKSERIDTGIIAIGPGKEYALAAIRAILAQPEVEQTTEEIVKKAFDVAAGVCILVNNSASIISLNQGGK